MSCELSMCFCERGDSSSPHTTQEDQEKVGGCSGEAAKYNFKIGRLKTGTPPRLDSRTIKFENLEEQYADEDPYFFSFLTKKNLNKHSSISLKSYLLKIHWSPEKTS